MALRTIDGKMICPFFGSHVQAEAWLGEVEWEGCFVGPPLAGRNLVHLARAAMGDGYTHFAINPAPLNEEPVNHAPITHLIEQAEAKAGMF
jgi:hypothetical protein